MKKNRIYCMATALALLAGACSSDTLEPGNENGIGGVSPEDGVYVAVNFSMPSASKGTRSFTEGENASNSGVEIGKDYENKVSSALIVLAKQDNSFIASASVPLEKIKEIGTTNDIYKTTSVFSKSVMAAYYNKPGFSRDIRVFVFCNPTKQLSNKIAGATLGDETWYNECGDYVTTSSENTIWGTDQFLMSNSVIAERTLPADMNDWNNYSTESNPFNLSGVNSVGQSNEVDNYNNGRGNVKVERTTARFDFRDGSIDGINNKDLNGIGDQTYRVVLDSENKGLVDVKLGKMALVNMNNKYYFLKRVSATGFDNDAIVCGPEMPWYSDATGTPVQGGNYVVDAYATWKSGDFKGVSDEKTVNFGTYLNYPFFNNNGTINNNKLSNDRWGTVLISNVLENKDNKYPEDNNQLWNAGNTLGDYRIWRYCIESTIPGIEPQKNAVTTGVVFKGQMLPSREATDADDKFTKDLLNALKITATRNSFTDPILYQFGGNLYCTWENIRRAALAASISDLKWSDADKKFTYSVNRSNSLYVAVFGNGGFGSFMISYNETDKNGSILNVGTQELKDDLDPDTNSANAAWEAWNNVGKGENVPELAAFRKAVTDANITIYQRSEDKELGGWGYYCYYYYWNRHNNNGQNGVMGPMEFAVVRNNVYKLAVTKIARLGHPRISENDPDKPTPDTDDEQSNVYITVQCETLPWVVRVNDIEF